MNQITIKNTSPLLPLLCALFLNPVQAGTMGSVQAGCCWTGPYMGLSVEAGGGTVRQTLNRTIVDTTISPPTIPLAVDTTTGSGIANGRVNGGTADFFLGYRVRPAQSNFIYGLQLNGNFFNSLEAKTIGTEQSQVRTTPTITTTNTQSPFAVGTRPTELVNVSGRVGVLIQEPTQLYGLIGLVGGRFADFNPNELTNNRAFYWRPGVIAGAGIEHQLSSHWSILAEYHFTSFRFSNRVSESFSNSVTNTFGTSTTTTDQVRTLDTRFNFNTAAIGVVYRWC